MLFFTGREKNVINLGIGFHHLPVHSQLNKTAECVPAHPHGGDGRIQDLGASTQTQLYSRITCVTSYPTLQRAPPYPGRLTLPAQPPRPRPSDPVFPADSPRVSISGEPYLQLNSAGFLKL
ncbi:unnamed protein product [Gadus morhua 'NCC']